MENVDLGHAIQGKKLYVHKFVSVCFECLILIILSRLLFHLTILIYMYDFLSDTGRSSAVPITIGMEHFVKVLTDFFFNFDMNNQVLLIEFCSSIIISIILSSYFTILYNQPGAHIFAILQTYTYRSLN